LRRLRARKPIVAIGVAYVVQEVSETPHGPDDEPLDWLVTEREAFKIGT
ncbi:MAG: 5-formyltetrahydrofolate cyclo-ligase, partial [Rhodospirillaceae bacterium]|nr:5-formyltetrahydrofolate cyclo-ligase [Rhodospirillaceae bacterium]